MLSSGLNNRQLKSWCCQYVHSSLKGVTLISCFFVISVKAVIQPSNSTDPGALTRPSSGHSSDPKIEKMIQQVKDVFPQVPYDTIRKDIGKY